MSQIKKNNFWATFISWFVTFTIGTAVGDYLGLKGRIFSLDTVLRFGIFMIIFVIMQLSYFHFESITHFQWIVNILDL
ncbi:hypothetical protein [Clostridium estertheticum]|uniref:hypothetical protein n=1 Tax=Clostridium estertheticum TaxID=238834 RepID=UPI001C6E4B33|nr:hypothetical protein [Clostridium estertheticum]MBW9151427.1 hypothetical protein [Clostridium estertheticum]WLC83432.1 hypothetical protein KTC97_15235 [Clostridium estertheticum]